MSSFVPGIFDSVFPGTGTGGATAKKKLLPDPDLSADGNPDGYPMAPGNPDNLDAGAARDSAAEEERRRRAGTGRASTILTSPLGEVGIPSARRVLLGLQ